ncbi:MAG: hypothetical protein A2V67_15200 [Deltaproteobacteria bacterium RBG_13_61_14]|nr:MAG: hypothetical protein A2V67_15200 [Deltaproteobacteria bacterium RBG_13_61_14]
MKPWLIRWIVAAGLAWPGLALAQDGSFPVVTEESLLQEMTDLSRLARQAPAGTRLIQFSSYDRKSRIEDGEKIDWFANRDIGNYLCKEQSPRGTEWVMAEVEGPGAIVRMWSANAGKRIWRVYLDGGEEPVIEAKGKDLLDGLKGGLPSVFSDKRNFGYNLYLPIPFQNGGKVTVAFPDGKDRETAPLMYYHVDVRTFSTGTLVETFSWEKLPTIIDKVEETSSRLLIPKTAFPKTILISEMSKFQELKPGESFNMDLSGSRAIYELTIAVKTDSDKNFEDVIGQTLLEINFDEADKPQVQSPLGEFFGSAPGIVPYNSLPLAVEKIENSVKLTSRWVMPFRNSAQITIINQSGETADFKVRATHADWDWGKDSLYFHAGYRSWERISTRPESDLTLLSATGPGRYVGTELNVRNHLEHYWWGEGDEKVYVDGESFPSIFGTGTEDYFGYAWCVQYFRFAHAYHGVPKPSRVWLVIPQMSTLFIPKAWVPVSKLMPGYDTTSQYRWQILDDIPFEKSIQFDLELLHHQKTVVDMESVSYWYAAPGATDNVPALDLKNREIW